MYTVTYSAVHLIQALLSQTGDYCPGSQRTLTMLVGVVALRYQHHITNVLCGADSRGPQLSPT